MPKSGDLQTCLQDSKENSHTPPRRRFFPLAKSTSQPWPGLLRPLLTCKPWTFASETRMFPGEGAWGLARTAPLEVPGPGPCQPQASSWPRLWCLSHGPLCPLHRVQVFNLRYSRAGTANMAAPLPLPSRGNRIFQIGARNSPCPGIFCLVHQFLAGPAVALVLNKAGIQSLV